MDLSTITLQSEGGVTTVTLNRPEQHNAINSLMVKELEKTCYQLEDESDDTVLILRGSGESFSAGIDLLDWPPDAKPDVRGFARWERACRTLERLPKVTMAAIDGKCAGGGLQLALTCDVRVATDRSVFYLHEVRDGFLPGMGTFRLAKFIGLGRARRMALTGRRVGAAEALSIGLVDHLCAPDELEAATAAALEEFGEINTEALKQTRRLFDESFEMAYEEFIGCFLAAQHIAIQKGAFKETIKRAHAEGKPRGE
jgi:enoyl-CoA hydratase/carnithine racemase